MWGADSVPSTQCSVASLPPPTPRTPHRNRRRRRRGRPLPPHLVALGDDQLVALGGWPGERSVEVLDLPAGEWRVLDGCTLGMDCSGWGYGSAVCARSSRGV